MAKALGARLSATVYRKASGRGSWAAESAPDFLEFRLHLREFGFEGGEQVFEGGAVALASLSFSLFGEFPDAGGADVPCAGFEGVHGLFYAFQVAAALREARIAELLFTVFEEQVDHLANECAITQALQSLERGRIQMG
jgi:hypothetical protein